MKFYITALVATVFSATPVPSLANANGQIEEQVISASPHGKTESEIAGSINIIDGEALQREVAATLGETLQNQTGIHSSSFGPGVGIPVIRGQSGKRVEILQNGRAVADASDTSADHAVATEALLADRIEILRGPSTLRYGAGAIGGVVNVIDNRIHTQRHQGIKGAVETRYSSNNHESVFIGRIDGGFGNLGLHLDGLTRNSNNLDIPGLANRGVDDPAETTNGFIANSNRENNSWNFGLSWIGDSPFGHSMVTGFSISEIDNNYGIPPGAHGHEGELADEDEEAEEFVRIDMDQAQYRGKLGLDNPGGIFDRLDIDLSYTDYNHREIETVDGTAEIGTLFDVQSAEIGAELTRGKPTGWPSVQWLGALGFAMSTRDFSATGEEAFVPASNTDNMGVYVIAETDIGPGTLELGVRYDNQSIASAGINDIEHDSLNLGASYLLTIQKGHRLGFILSRSERSPVSEELLSDGEHIATSTYEIGDDSLGTETAINAELTWVYQAEKLTAKASLFYSDFSGYIHERDTELRFSHDLEEAGATGLNACSDDLVAFEHNREEFAGSVECFVYSQEDAEFKGLEAELGFALNDQNSLRVRGDFVHAKLDQSGDVPRLPPARLSASWQFASGLWSAQLSATHALAQNRPGTHQEATQGYTRLGAYLGYTKNNLTLFAKGTNLTNREIRNSTSFLRELAPEAGLGVTMGARYRF